MHWYIPNKIDDVSEALSGLRDLGVSFEVDERSVRYEVKEDGGHEILMKSIGWVIVRSDGRIVCKFRGGCNGRDIRVLVGTAERAALGMDVPAKAAGWHRDTHKGERRWYSIVLRQVRETEDEIAARILEDHRHGRCLGDAALEGLIVKAEADA